MPSLNFVSFYHKKECRCPLARLDRTRLEREDTQGPGKIKQIVG